ncbi:MAG: ATP-binding protein [Alphaproteobacteria bacterium]
MGILAKRLSVATQAGKIGVWDYDTAGGTLLWDSSMFCLYGVDLAAFSGRPADWWERLHPEDVEGARHAFEAALSERGSMDHSARLIGPDGSVRHVKIYAEMVVFANDTPRLIGVNVDVSEQIELAERERCANQLKTEFLVNISHEIRTPLNGIMGMAQLLPTTGLNEQQSEMARVINACGHNLLTVINDVLDISKIETGLLELNIRDFDLNKLLDEIVGTFTLQAEAKGIRLEKAYHADTVLTAHADRERMRQVIVNLIGNAVKFTEAGFVRVRTRKGQETLFVEIEDTGPGIPKSVLPVIFERFRQGDSSLTRKHGGTGLGLAIARDLIQLMGGAVTVDSTEGRGSLFGVEIPASSRTPVGDTVASRPGPLRQDARPTHSGNLPRKVLLAEDDRNNQDVICRMLESLGIKDITVASHGGEALEAVISDAFDLLLMDINMPMVSGAEAIRHIRAMKTPVADIPIIVVTANAMNSQCKDYMAIGADNVLKKPIGLATLEAALSAAMKGETKIGLPPFSRQRA